LGSHDSRAVALGDVDGDGDLDMVMCTRFVGIEVYKNDGQGMYTDSIRSLLVRGCRTVVLGDVDNDGDLDMVVGADTQENSVYFNQ